MKIVCLALLAVCAVTATRPGKSQTTPKVLSHCDSLRVIGSLYSNDGPYKAAYDTLQLFVDQCAAGIHQPSYRWASVFGGLGGAFAAMQVYDWHYNEGFRNWLLDVLYINPDSDYYCADVDEIVSSFQADSLTGTEIQASRDRIAVMEYISQSGKCPLLAHDYIELIDRQKAHRRQAWEDSLKFLGIDPSTQSFDSSLPSIDDLGLSLLRGNPNGGVAKSQDAPSLLSVSALNNPFNRDLDLNVDMGREALVTVEMFDLLGNAVPLTGMKYMLKQSGPQRIPVPVGSLAIGTYYLRVSTDWGDIKTIKVIKE